MLRLALPAAGLLLALAGCTETKLAVHAAKQAQTPSARELGVRQQGAYKVGNPYQINGVWYYPSEDPNYDQTGIASWYGEQFHGRQTANGEIYDMNELTAAHQTLPMPSVVRVTNLENGRSIVVRVNDRGPFANGRIIDMSRRGAQLLGFERQGTAKVRVQILPQDGQQPSTMVAQAGAERPQVVAAPRGSVSAETLTPPPGRGQAQPVPQTSAPQPSAVQVLAAQPASVPSAPPPQQVQQLPVQPTGIFVQAGAFSQFDNANRLRARLSVIGPAAVNQVNVRGQDFFRVRVGPLASVEEADRALAQVISVGQSDARIVVD
ncbi:MAG: septal ring lytic transglycosylase RlpA family protein [Alphaproteobacteria bacterium]|nr:septal ring lytic transglycosylase RlpA family protein [Alphaproteobacteria bacterium]